MKILKYIVRAIICFLVLSHMCFAQNKTVRNFAAEKANATEIAAASSTRLSDHLAKRIAVIDPPKVKLEESRFNIQLKRLIKFAEKDVVKGNEPLEEVFLAMDRLEPQIQLKIIATAGVAATARSVIGQVQKQLYKHRLRFVRLNIERVSVFCGYQRIPLKLGLSYNVRAEKRLDIILNRTRRFSTVMQGNSQFQRKTYYFYVDRRAGLFYSQTLSHKRLWKTRGIFISHNSVNLQLFTSHLNRVSNSRQYHIKFLFNLYEFVKPIRVGPFEGTEIPL